MITDELDALLATKAGVRPVIARIALEHTRGRMDIALDYLSDEVCMSRFMRDARELHRSESERRYFYEWYYDYKS